MNILFEQFYIYFVLISIGYLAARLKIITPQNSSFLSAFILKISFPLLMLTSIPHLPFEKGMIGNILFVFLGTYFALLILGITGFFSSRVFQLSYHQQRIHVLHHMFGNVVFIGFPFINSLFPGEGLLYAAIFQLASDSILWTFGIYYIRNKAGKRFEFSHLINVNSLAFLIALLAWLVGWSIPAKIESPFAKIGHATLPLSLIYVGYMLSTCNIETSIKKRSIFSLTLTKQIIVPLALLIVVFYAIHPFLPFLSKTAVAALILQTGMPAMATIAILAEQYKSDEKLASENILITTIFSIITLPLLLYFINAFYP